MYTTTDYPSKAALKRALANGDRIGTFQPGGWFPPMTNGTAYLEGPHYPKPHTWYAQVEVADGFVVKVIL